MRPGLYEITESGGEKRQIKNRPDNLGSNDHRKRAIFKCDKEDKGKHSSGNKLDTAEKAGVLAKYSKFAEISKMYRKHKGGHPYDDF